MATLRGITWDHTRGYSPMAATAQAFAQAKPRVEIIWEKRSLQAFADQPIDELATTYDLIVIDHPHVGTIARNSSLLPLDGQGFDDQLDTLASQSIGRSHESYAYEGHQWALPIDAAAQVAVYRPDLLATAPTTWPQVLELATAGRVLWPIKPVDAISSYFTLSANLGAPCGTDPDRLIDRDIGREVLRIMRTLAMLVPAECLTMNPILVCERMVNDDTFAYCPLLYGYNNYARRGYRNRPLRFTNIPAVGNQGPRGSNLGGTGIAITARCREPKLALQYALWIAGAACQRGIYFQSGGQPANAQAWSDPVVNAAAGGFFDATRWTMDSAYLRPRHHGYMAFQDRGGDIVNACLANRMDIDTAQDQLDAAYQLSWAEHHKAPRALP